MIAVSKEVVMTTDPGSTRALVVYESMFGNTRLIAEAVGGALSEQCTVQVVDVAHAPLAAPDVELLIVGGPTHAFGMSRPSTRTGARDQGATGAVERGVREWLDEVRFERQPVVAAAFDTRMRSRFPVGSARRPISRRLRRLGLHVSSSASFVVSSTFGPLESGQLAAAQRWAAQLVVMPQLEVAS